MVGIVVLNYETWELSLRCMESIQKACEDSSYRIYLVDNASKRLMPQQVRDYIHAQKDHARFLRSKQNRGYAAGNNLGMRQALADRCEVVVIANNDILFQEQAIQRLANFLLKYPEVGIVGPKVIDEKGETQVSRCSMHTGIREIFQINTGAKKVFRKKWRRYYCLDQDSEKSSYAYYVSGCCFAVSRECAKVIFPLDEKTMLYYEEPIIGIRMKQAGYDTCYLPESVVVHQHGATTRHRKPFMYQCIGQSELYYCSVYARATWWELWLLYIYREMLFLLHCRKGQGFRQYWKSFHKEHKKAYKKACAYVRFMKTEKQTSCERSY